MAKFLEKTKDFLGWVPLVLFFMVLAIMFLADFRSATDEYFVRVVLRSCLIVILAVGVVQIGCLWFMATSYFLCTSKVIAQGQSIFTGISRFAVVDLFIFSVAIFYRPLTFTEWVLFLSVVFVIPTMGYWLKMIHGPIRDMHAFARLHKISFWKTARVLNPFYINAFTMYFFIALKRTLLPLTFVFISSDFRIIVPRLVEAGLSLESFILFLSLFISLHLLSFKEGEL